MRNRLIEKYFPGVGLNELACYPASNNDHKGLYRLLTILAVAGIVGVVFHKINKKKEEG